MMLQVVFKLKPIVINLGPLAAQAYGFTTSAMNLYNATDPFEAISAGVSIVIERCTKEIAKYSIECGLLWLQAVVAGCLGGFLPFTILTALAKQVMLIKRDDS